MKYKQYKSIISYKILLQKYINHLERLDIIIIRFIIRKQLLIGKYCHSLMSLT